jgi:hypothetical protein
VEERLVVLLAVGAITTSIGLPERTGFPTDDILELCDLCYVDRGRLQTSAQDEKDGTESVNERPVKSAVSQYGVSTKDGCGRSVDKGTLVFCPFPPYGKLPTLTQDEARVTQV